MTRDNDRRRVYIAEEACLAGTAFAEAPGQTALTVALRDVFRSPWWVATVGATARVTFADNSGSGFYRHGERRIHLGRTTRWLVAAHELAHMAAEHDRLRAVEAAAHDEGFCGWEVVIFRVLFGAAASDLLASGFRALGVSHTLPPATRPLPEPALWQRYVPGNRRGGWQRPQPAVPAATLATGDPIPLG
jgi:hypothetical protein